MTAAAELIAELGWGRVTTRAVAQRAGLPHGAVSYHFRGKQELLTEAALHAFQQAVPLAQFEALTTVDDLIGLIARELSDPDAIDPVLSRLMLETMREAERDPALRERMAAMLGEYRRLIVSTVRADQKRGAVFTGAPPAAVATLLAAVGDGLLLHVLLDPELDTAPAIEALRAMLGTRSGDSPLSS
jgi:AcrR family transcriptional regulator